MYTLPVPRISCLNHMLGTFAKGAISIHTPIVYRIYDMSSILSQYKEKPPETYLRGCLTVLSVEDALWTFNLNNQPKYYKDNSNSNQQWQDNMQ